MASLVEKRLAGPVAIPNIATTILTVPANHRYAIKQIILTNTDVSARTLSLAIGTTATVSNRFLSDLSLTAGEVLVLDTAIVLEAAETLVAIASTTNVINIIATGWDNDLL